MFVRPGQLAVGWTLVRFVIRVIRDTCGGRVDRRIKQSDDPLTIFREVITGVVITELDITELFYYGLLLPNVAHSIEISSF